MSRHNLVLVTLILLAIALFGWLGLIELRAEEPRRAIVSIEMLLSGNWIVPHINGWAYYNKPPVFNWLMAAFFALAGSMEEWVVRLPSLLSFILLGFLNYRFTRKYVSERVAVLSSLFFLTGADLLFYGTVNTGEIDLFYSLVVYLQVMAIFIFFHRKEYLKMFLWSYFLVAIGFLTKGMPSLAFQAITVLAVAIYHRKFLLLLGWQHLLGILLFAGLSGIYLYFYGLQDNAIAFLVRQFKEASQRTGLETPLTDTLIQFVTFPLQLIKLLLPWSLLVFFFFRKGFFRSLFENNFIAFSALFFVFNILLYWISGDFKARYYYMFFPFLCVLLAYYFEKHQESMPVTRKVIFSIFNIIALVLPLAFIAVLFIPQTAVLPGVFLKVIVVVIIAAIASFIYFRYKQKIYALVLLLVVARIGFNVFYLPALQNDDNVMYYRDAVAGLLEISGDEPVYLYGEPYTFKSDASVGPFTFKEAKLTTAPRMAYQISYYISSGNGHVLQFTEEILPGRYYIAPASAIDEKRYPILYRFEDKWQHQEMVLIRS